MSVELLDPSGKEDLLMRAQGRPFSSQNTPTYTSSFHSPTAFTPGCQGLQGSLSLSRLSAGSPLKTQQHLAIIILSLLLPEASLVGNFYPTCSQVESPYSLGLMETTRSHPEEGGKKKKVKSKVRHSRFLLSDCLLS